MSAVSVIRYLLAHDSNLTDVVAAARIKAGDLPLNTALPAISIKQSRGTSHNTVAMNEAVFMWTDEIDVTVMTDNYPDVKTILGLVRDALPLSRGTVNSIVVDSILDNVTGSDMYDQQTGIYEQTQSYTVRYYM